MFCSKAPCRLPYYYYFQGNAFLFTKNEIYWELSFKLWIETSIKWTWEDVSWPVYSFLQLNFINFNASCSLLFFLSWFFLMIIHESQDCKQRGRALLIFLTSRAINAESSPLRLTSDWTQTLGLREQFANHWVTRP